MTENECARFYMKLIEAGREVEKMKNNFLTIFGVDIEAFDNIHDKLADAAFQAIISTKFGGNPPNEKVEHDFIQSRLDQHMNNYIDMITTTEQESSIPLYDWIVENIQFLLED